MNIDESVFAYKLYEMEEQYGNCSAGSGPVSGAEGTRTIPNWRKPEKSMRKTHC